MISLNIPKVLFIKGVFKKDCIQDDFLEAKIINNIDTRNNTDNIINNNVFNEFEHRGNEINTRVVYKKLPSLFETLDEWPDKTNLLCWHCSLPFDTMPVFIPKVVEPVISKIKKAKFSMGVYGVFCSFGDAVEFIKMSNWLLIDKIEALNKLKHLYKIFYGTTLKEIAAYPSVFNMVQYGGDMDISQYKEMINNFKTDEELLFLDQNI